MSLFKQMLFRRYIHKFAEFIQNNSRITAIEYKLNGVLFVEEKTYGWESIIIDAYYPGVSKIYIGKYCSISKNIRIITGGIHPVNWISTYPLRIHYKEPKRYLDGMPATNGDVVIGNDVWIGTDVIILSGVTIGDGVVIAAGSVVTKDIEPYSFVGGNPAKLIRFRFSKPQIDSLLSLRWWDWDDEKVKENIEYLSSDNIEDFLENCKKKR